jgi:hypothetical protein
MLARELQIGDVFRVAGETRQWRKTGPATFEPAGWQRHWSEPIPSFARTQVELVERVGEIGRSGDTLILRGGEVTLQFDGYWPIHSHTPGDPLTLFVLTGSFFGASRAKVPTADTAIGFVVRAGAKHLGRPQGSGVFAYGGRVYARATNPDARGTRRSGSYTLYRVVDGKRRLVIAGLLTLPGEPALYDIIMEHFGPDTVPR